MLRAKIQNILAMWDKFFAIRNCAPLRRLAETDEMFPNFEPTIA